MDNPAAPIPSTPTQSAFSSPVGFPNHRWLLWLSCGLAVLTLGIAIGIFSAKFLNQSPSPSQLPPTPTPTLSPISSLDPYREPAGSAATADWKTYQITHDPATSYPNYEIKLPPGWKQIEHSSNFQSSEKFQNSLNEDSVQIDILKNSSVNLAEFLAKFDEEIQTSWEGKPGRQVLKTQVAKRGIYEVIEREEIWSAAGFTAKVIYLPVNQLVFSVASFPYSAEGPFDQILSTFKFTDETSSAPTSTINTKKLTYFLPSGWKTVQSSNRSFEVSYDPDTTRADVNSYVQDGISLFKENFTNAAYFTVRLMSYSGGSRHQFLYNYLGEKPVKEDLMPNYHETEYLYDGKSCLFLVGISISQFPTTFGMCDAGGGKAFLITSFDNENYEEPLRTIKPL